MLERDIELAFDDYLNTNGFRVLGHQVQLPLGKLDILAMIESRTEIIPVVVELKRGTINEKACTQLLGYMEQVEHILRTKSAVEVYREKFEIERCRGILVGEAINKMSARVVSMMKMDFCRYDIINGQIAFTMHEAYGETPADEYQPTGALKTLFILTERAKAKRLVYNTQALSTQENFQAFTEGKSGPSAYESLETTVRYWHRKSK